jgi:hypothetical protein
MVAHQTIGVHLPTGLLTRLRQGLKEIVPIHVIQINVLSAISPAHDVIHRAGILDAHLPWHDATLVNSASIVKANKGSKSRSDPFSGAIQPACAAESRIGEVALLRGLGPQGSRPGAGYFRAHRRALVDVFEDLAVPGNPANPRTSERRVLSSGLQLRNSWSAARAWWRF